MTPRIALSALLSAAILLAATARPAAAGTLRVQVAELSPQAEAAIEKGLRFLVKDQNPDGSWGKRYPSAITGLAMMAFMLKGYFPEKGQHSKTMDKALAWLLKRGKEGGGYLGGTNQGMYEHGLATHALSEVWGMTNKEETRDILKRAVGVILRAQNGEGGWRYQPQPLDADVSVTVMQIVALASAQEAGILVPAQVIKKATEYVKKCERKPEGGFGYQVGGSNPSLSSSAAGLLSLLMCGERESKEAKRGIQYLLRLPKEEFNQTKFYHYGHYYAVQAMYQAGEDNYQEWYPRIHDALLKKQRDDGSWLGDGGESDPAFGTAMSILILGVPYRFLPIYQR